MKTFTLTSIGVACGSKVHALVVSKIFLHTVETNTLSVGIASAKPSAISISFPSAVKTGTCKPTILDTNVPEAKKVESVILHEVFCTDLFVLLAISSVVLWDMIEREKNVSRAGI